MESIHAKQVIEIKNGISIFLALVISQKPGYQGMFILAG
jgi:hypothetical protein